jgi:1,2-diacylglycerol 3-alpha-glucosyltransferase
MGLGGSFVEIWFDVVDGAHSFFQPSVGRNCVGLHSSKRRDFGMRLLILTLQVAPYHDARYVGALRHFDEVHVLSTVNAGDFDEFLAKHTGSYSLHRLYDGPEAYRSAVASGDLGWQVRDIIERLAPDAIAVAGWTAPESLVALAEARAKKIPAVVMSESQADDAQRMLLREALKRRIVSQFDAALVGGPIHAEYAISLGIPRPSVHYGYNAVNNAYFASGAQETREKDATLRRELNLPSRYILASARFIAKKNLPNLVRAYAEARASVADVPALVILGDGPERAEIERAISETGQVCHVHLPGFQEYRDLPKYYALSEGFVHVATSEQWGLVINEAMSCGVPIVVSERCGATRTVVEHGVNGFVVATDVSAITQGLVSLFKLSPEARGNMGRAAADAISSWGPDRFGAGMRAAVDSAQSARRRGRLSLPDQMLLGRLAKRIIATVS